MDYRFLISHHRGQERMLIQAQVWAPEWVSGPAPDDDDQPVRRDWFTADQWTINDAPKKLTKTALHDICAARGWAPWATSPPRRTAPSWCRSSRPTGGRSSRPPPTTGT